MCIYLAQHKKLYILLLCSCVLISITVFSKKKKKNRDVYSILVMCVKIIVLITQAITTKVRPFDSGTLVM